VGGFGERISGFWSAAGVLCYAYHLAIGFACASFSFSALFNRGRVLCPLSFHIFSSVFAVCFAFLASCLIPSPGLSCWCGAFVSRVHSGRPRSLLSSRTGCSCWPDPISDQMERYACIVFAL